MVITTGRPREIRLLQLRGWVPKIRKPSTGSPPPIAPIDNAPGRSATGGQRRGNPLHRIDRPRPSGQGHGRRGEGAQGIDDDRIVGSRLVITGRFQVDTRNFMAGGWKPMQTKPAYLLPPPADRRAAAHPACISNAQRRTMNSAGRTAASPNSTIILPAPISCAVIVCPRPQRTKKACSGGAPCSAPYLPLLQQIVLDHAAYPKPGAGIVRFKRSAGRLPDRRLKLTAQTAHRHVKPFIVVTGQVRAPQTNQPSAGYLANGIDFAVPPRSSAIQVQPANRQRPGQQCR